MVWAARGLFLVMLSALFAFAGAVRAAGPTLWLDKPLSNWNVTGSPIPRPLKGDIGDPSDIARCKSELRAPSSVRDRMLAQRGWLLFSASVIPAGMPIVAGTSGVDGMCRPNPYQYFVFVGNHFVGTVAPNAMGARSDGAASTVHPRSARAFSVDFVRYNEQDPLCCPSRTSTVAYRIEGSGAKAVLVPLSVKTVANPK